MGMINKGIVGGSVRRMSALVKDLEIIIRPVITEIETLPEQPSLLNPTPILKEVSMFEEKLQEFFDLHPKFSMGNRNGPKYKVLEYQAGHDQILKIDCFIVPDPRAWGVQVVIRTGPAMGWNKPLMTWLRTIKMHTSNGLLHNHAKYRESKTNRGQCQNDQCRLIIPCPTEESFFHAIQLPMISPNARGSDTLTRAINQRKRNVK